MTGLYKKAFIKSFEECISQGRSKSNTAGRAKKFWVEPNNIYLSF